MDAVTKFLSDKRKQQKTRDKAMMLTVAPSMSTRYGLDDMGGYPVQSGKYTGSGPNGVVEPMLPTERRVSSNGKQYGVDEGEVVVNDAETVAAYGGAQALDQFIQQHRPDQQQMAREMNAQGVPRYSIGGIPSIKPVIKPTTYRQPGVGVDVGSSTAINNISTNSANTAPAQNSLLSMDLPELYQRIMTPTTPVVATGQQSVPSPLLRETTFNAAPVVAPDTSLFAPTETPATQVNASPAAPAPVFAPPSEMTETPAPLTKTNVTPAPAIAVAPPSEMTETPAPLTKTNVTPAPAITVAPPIQTATPPATPPAAPGATGPQKYSAANLDEMILNRYMNRLGGMNESERAAEEQRLLQQGIPQETINAAIAQSDVSRRSAEGAAVSEYATDAAGRAQQQNQFNRTQGLAETQYMNTQTDKEWNDALNSYDPATPEGLQALQNLYVKNHPGQPAPDMNALIDQRTAAKQSLAGGAQTLATNEWNNALATYDPATPEGLKALQDLYAQQHPGMPAPDLNVLTEQRNYQKQIQGINVDNLITKLGQDKFDVLKDRMDTGMTYETYAPIAAQFGAVLNKTEYEAMRQYTAAGVADWNKNLSAVTTLLETGGAENITNAATKLNEMFPGLNIDFSGKITEENQVKFSNGMSNLTKLAVEGAKYDDVKAALTKDGVFTDLGMDEKDVKAMFEQQVDMQDPLYRSAYAISDKSIQLMYPDATTPELINKYRTAYAKMSSTGFLKINADGTFSPDTNLLQEVLGDDWMTGGTGGGETPAVTYAEYSAAATEAGEVPKSEAAWIGAGRGAFMKAGTGTRGTIGYKFASDADSAAAWTKFKADANESNIDITNLDKNTWINQYGAPEAANYKSYSADTVYDPSTSTAPYSFTSAGAMWTASKGTTQTTSKLISDQTISITGKPATIQGSSVIVPMGDYLIIDETHIQSKLPDKGGLYTTYDLTGKNEPVKHEEDWVTLARTGVTAGWAQGPEQTSTGTKIANFVTGGLYSFLGGK